MADIADPRITVLKGFVDESDVGRLFAAADFALFPFRRISTSGSLMLALTFGVPVIAPAVPALADLVRNGREGLLFDPAEPDDLSRALVEAAVLDEKSRLAMGRHALARARGFPPGDFASGMAELLLELPAQEAPPKPARRASKRAPLSVVEPGEGRRAAPTRRRRG